MSATTGYIVPEYVEFPSHLAPSLDLKFEDVPNGPDALSKVPAAGWGRIFAFVDFFGTLFITPYGEPGNFGKGSLGLGAVGVSASAEDPELRATKLALVLANGRLATMAIIGLSARTVWPAPPGATGRSTSTPRSGPS